MDHRVHVIIMIIMIIMIIIMIVMIIMIIMIIIIIIIIIMHIGTWVCGNVPKYLPTTSNFGPAHCALKQTFLCSGHDRR